MFLCILNSIELLSSSGALELDVRLIPTLLVVAHDSNVARGSRPNVISSKS